MTFSFFVTNSCFLSWESDKILEECEKIIPLLYFHSCVFLLLDCELFNALAGACNPVKLWHHNTVVMKIWVTGCRASEETLCLSQSLWGRWALNSDRRMGDWRWDVWGEEWMAFKFGGVKKWRRVRRREMSFRLCEEDSKRRLLQSKTTLFKRVGKTENNNNNLIKIW